MSSSPKLDQLRARVPKARPLANYVPGLKVMAIDPMGPPVGMPKQYTYTLTARVGKDFDPDFRPAYNPGQMLQLGVFSGKYLNDCTGEFPREWFEKALKCDKLKPDEADPGANMFGIKSRKSVQYWRKKGWIPITEGDCDPRGWFQWYCRYWLGRRMPEVDAVQIRRWKAFRRHAGQITADYARLSKKGKPVPSSLEEKMSHRPRQRQALLQWSYDPRV